MSFAKRLLAEMLYPVVRLLLPVYLGWVMFEWVRGGLPDHRRRRGDKDK